jgi:ribosomal protein S18 acetylase RimI-like enzyme
MISESVEVPARMVGVQNVRMIRLRAADPDDDRRLAFLDRATWSPTNSPIPLRGESVDFFSSDPVQNVIVADRDGNPVGYVKLRWVTEENTDLTELAISGTAVEPGQQRLGIGSCLVAEVIEEANRRGAVKLTFHVVGTSAAAIALYKSRGFRVAKVRSGAFLIYGVLVDDLVIKRSLDNA